MLTISKAIKAGQGEYYLSLAGLDDYYTAGNEPPGYWLGRGAAALRLDSELNQEHFRNLLRGLAPDGERKLVRNADHERRAGWDFTWSAPKSVSVAWSQADPATRERIEQCLRRAAAAGVAYLEEVAGISRRGEDGHSHEAARLVLAAFLHSTSRAQDPQLHLHTILLNVGVRADGTTGTLEPKGLYRHQMAAGALFRAELAAQLETELGLRARREQRAFELLGVDPELIAFFSKRRAAIEAELARRGQSGGRAAERANFATRAVKEARPRAELFAEWQRIGHEHHWSAKELALKKSVLTTAEAMQQRRQLLPIHWTEEAIARHSRLTGEQTEALRHLCAARGGFPRIPCSGQCPLGNTHAGFQNLMKRRLPPADEGVKSPPVSTAQNQFSLTHRASRKSLSGGTDRAKPPQANLSICVTAALFSWVATDGGDHSMPPRSSHSGRKSRPCKVRL